MTCKICGKQENPDKGENYECRQCQNDLNRTCTTYYNTEDIELDSKLSDLDENSTESDRLEVGFNICDD